MLSSYISEESRQRHEERIADANEWRLGQAAQGERPTRLARLQVALGARLIALGGWLQSGAMEPLMSARRNSHSSVKRVS